MLVQWLPHGFHPGKYKKASVGHPVLSMQSMSDEGKWLDEEE